ncbi:MAG: glycosyltransferase [Rubripirellula sp.]
MTCRVMLMVSSMRGGGSERQTLLLLQKIDRHKLTPHLYLLERDGDLLDQVPKDVPIHSFDEVSRGSELYFPGRKLRQQTNHVGKVIDQQAIDVVYDRTFHMTMLAGSACKGRGIPRVSTIVSPPDHALPLVESRFVGLKRRRLATAYHQSRSVVAVSQQAADSAEHYYGLPKGRVQVIPNPIDIEATREQATLSQVSRDQRLTIVCVGRMTIEKGHNDLIRGLHLCEQNWPEHLPAIRIWLVGDGPLRDDLQALWQQHSRGIHTIDFLGAQNAASYIDSADALLLPSLFEGMPNVVLEAMALETPVIATRAGGTIELERDEPTIQWIDPGNPNSIATSIREFALDRHSANQRVNAASRLVQQAHDAGNITHEIEALLLQA